MAAKKKKAKAATRSRKAKPARAAPKPPAPPRRRGRPTTYTEAKAAEICAWLSMGKTLVDYCAQPGKPGLQTVADWQKAHPDFAVDFARARETWADVLEEQALQIADTPVPGEIVTEEDVEVEGVDEAGNKAMVPGKKRKVTTEDMLGHRKLQVWTRLQLVARRTKKKVEHEHTGKLSLEEIVHASLEEDGAA